MAVKQESKASKAPRVVVDTFSALFRALPKGAEISLNKPRNWCTAQAVANGRQIQTKRVFCVSVADGGSTEHTLISFLNEPSQARVARNPLATPADSRQLAIGWC